MGRPLKKDVNGVEVLGSNTYGDVDEKNAGITCEFWDTSLHTDGGLIKQRGAKTYVVATIGNIVEADHNESENTSTCTLQAAEPSAPGQMRIAADNSGATVYIAKITKRLMTDFSGNRYTWEMTNYEDSTGDKIALVPVS